MQNYCKVVSLILLSILVSSCSHWKQQKLETPQWQISGKIIVREVGKKAASAQFNWQQQDDRYLIHILSPLGQVLMRLSGDDKQAQFTDSKGNSYEADSAEDLLAQFSTWQLPITHLQYWVNSQLLGDENNRLFNTQKQPIAATKSPWQVNWQYLPNSATARKVSLHNSLQQQKITIIIKSYEQLPAL